MRLESITASRVPGALVHPGRSGRAAERRRMARHAGQIVALERGHELGRNRRALLRLPDLLRPRRGRRREAGAARRDRPHHPPHSRSQLPADRRRRPRTRWGWWGPDAIWDDPDETGLRAAHPVAPAGRAPPDDRPAIPREISGRLRRPHHHAQYHWLTRNQKIMVPGAINHSDDELAFLSYYPLLRYETTRGSSRSTSRASSGAGGSNGRSATRSGTSSTRPAPARGIRSGRLDPHALGDPDGHIQWTVGTPIGSTCPSIRCAIASRPPPGPHRPAVRRAADVEVERQPVQPRRRQRRTREDDGAYFLLPIGWAGFTS